MRNLKKILALVLALIMSLSLMATAGASSFPDVDDENPYATAIEVLDKLKVFQGYKEDGTFRPTETLNRAQAAVLVYRIATGDVEDKYLENYTFMQQSKFEDLDGYNWAKGYINYCQNAEIVVGTSATTFEPGAKVTGYQLLVMLLRTLGYGKAGEFSDPKGWELQTAAIAEREGILKNVTQGDLGAPAPRQMVAEILFRGLLTEKVAYSLMAANGYTKTGKTLGQEQFGLEQVEGVVMANEWANLKDGSAGEKVLAVGKTDLKVTKVQDVGATVEVGKTYTLDYTTDLDAVGLRQSAYIAGKTSPKQVLTITDDGLNTVAYNEGKGVATGKSNEAFKTIKALADDKGLSLTNKTEWFVDYAKQWDEECTSEYRISYAIAKGYYSITSDEYEYLENCLKSGKAITRTVNLPDAAGNAAVATACYMVAIQPAQKITVMDQKIMKDIFYNADRLFEDPTTVGTDDYVSGEVYVGTTSTKDYSDTMSWPAFRTEYFTDTENNKKFSNCEMGNSLRIIDNNNDGDADYALRVDFTQDIAVGTYKNALLFRGQALAEYSEEKNTLYCPDELAVGDVANWNLIDGKLRIWKAADVTETITAKNYQKITVSAGDNTYEQSGIDNKTGMDQLIMQMDNQTEYIIYLDTYGFARSYKLAQAEKYALLTEMYAGGSNNGNFVTGSTQIAEYKVGSDPLTEKVVGNPAVNPFFSQYIWTFGETLNGYYGTYNTYYSKPNYLQPAIAHLAATVASTPINTGSTNGTPSYEIGTARTWARIAANPVSNSARTDIGVFGYGRYATNVTNYTGYTDSTSTDPYYANKENSFSFTNVAAYTEGANDTINLKTAAQLATDENGQQLYRVGSSVTGASPASSATANLRVGLVGTETALKAAYSKDYPTGNASAWWKLEYTDATRDGTHIYPVYAVDYVQLDLKDLNSDAVVVANGQRHYPITGTYGTQYNALTNLNAYVDATVNTAIYVVTPNGVNYYEGINGGLPNIRAKEIRAAYAVATNTAVASNGYDFWQADVIVIETTTLDYDYESISLMYNNPSEASGATQLVYSLNNQWVAYNGADAENKAMMNVVPEAIDWNKYAGQVVWANSPWSTNTSTGYGFYTLFQTAKQDDGTLGAKSVTKITGDWNKYGIYAGTVTRTSAGMTASNYMDVSAVKTGDQPHSFTINTADYQVPFYRLTQTYANHPEATEISLNDINSYSDVRYGDKLIWVYNKLQNRVAFVIDVTPRTNTQTIPGWLSDMYDTIKAATDANANVGTIKKVTLTGADATSTAALPAKTSYDVTYGQDFGLLQRQLVKPGYTLTAMTDNGSSVTPAPTVGYAMGAVTADHTLQITATQDNYTVTVAGVGTTDLGAINKYEVSTDGGTTWGVATNGPITNGSIGATYHYGDMIKFTLAAATNNKANNATVTKGAAGEPSTDTENVDGTEIILTVKGDATITFGVVAATALAFVGGPNTVATTPTTAGTVQFTAPVGPVYPAASGDITLSATSIFTPFTNETVISVKWAQVGGKSGESTVDGSNNFKIPYANLNATGDIVLTPVVQVGSYPVTIKANGISVQVTYTDAAGASQTTYTADLGTALNVKPNTSISIVTVGEGSVTFTVAATPAGCISRATGNGAVATPWSATLTGAVELVLTQNP